MKLNLTNNIYYSILVAIVHCIVFVSAEDDANNFPPDQPPEIRVPYPNSPVYLTRLAHTEQLIYRHLLDYESKLQQRLEILRRC